MTAPGIACVFAKEPQPGHAKTRLAATLGTEAAAALARAFLDDTLALVGSLDCRVVVAASPDGFRTAGAPRHWPQGGGDLGVRLERAARRALSEAPWVLLLGTDSPGLPRSQLDEAIAALADADGPDAVIGPCDDGGYYALGLRRPCSLSPVRWSTAHARSDTETALERAGLRLERLRSWFDVDERDDLDRLSRLIAAGEIHAPRTARALDDIASMRTAGAQPR